MTDDILEGLSITGPILSVEGLKPAKKGRGGPRKKVPKGPLPTVIFKSAEVTDAFLHKIYSELNHSELVEVCRRVGLKADRSVPRDVLIQMAMEEDQLVKPPPSEEMRARIQNYLDRNPSMGTNPKVCPRNCNLCPDVIVFHCYSQYSLSISANRAMQETLGASDKVVRGRKCPFDK
jgi:hypothetical protein